LNASFIPADQGIFRAELPAVEGVTLDFVYLPGAQKDESRCTFWATWSQQMQATREIQKKKREEGRKAAEMREYLVKNKAELSKKEDIADKMIREQLEQKKELE
jgi:hypothetical protein